MYGKMVFLLVLVVLVAIATTVSGDYFTSGIVFVGNYLSLKSFTASYPPRPHNTPKPIIVWAHTRRPR
jgi:hypothetical protein